MPRLLTNPHPGEILKEEFLMELGLSQNALAQAIDVPPNRINEIVRGRRGITADTDLRLCRFFNLSEGYWLRLQNTYDLMEAHRSSAIQRQIQRIIPYEDDRVAATQ
ncbi:MAG: HigA family addiction module antidote protein [Alphaproteobacteria bacterium]|nr:HigA family addiction module antidote protein [Alphaproteobacteria bacterium]